MLSIGLLRNCKDRLIGLRRTGWWELGEEGRAKLLLEGILNRVLDPRDSLIALNQNARVPISITHATSLLNWVLMKMSSVFLRHMPRFEVVRAGPLRGLALHHNLPVLP